MDTDMPIRFCYLERNSMQSRATELSNYITKLQIDINRLISNLAALIPSLSQQDIIDELTMDGFGFVRELSMEKRLPATALERHASYFWFQMLMGTSSEEMVEEWELTEPSERLKTLNDEDEIGSHNHLRSFILVQENCSDKNLLFKAKVIIQKIFFNLYCLISFLGKDESYKARSILDFDKRLKAKDTGPSIVSKTSELYSQTKDSEQGTQTLEEIIVELEKLIGLEDIKDELKSLISFVNVNKLRLERGLKSIDVSLHCVFSGPPGTGKTTIARLLGRAYQALGILKKGHIIETDRSQLVAGYLGQTALKTKEILDQALDGVLFIDEAYSLSQGKDLYGKEAIDTILKFMEDNRSRFVLIVAGYEEEMSSFLESNPGLRSRFNKKFYFKNYTVDELILILKKVFTSNGFQLQPEALPLFRKKILDGIELETSKFGNARYVRNLSEATIQNQFNRVAKNDNPSIADLTLIKVEDVPTRKIR